MSFFQKINPQNPPKSIDTNDVFIVLRERILQYGLLGISVIATILVPLLIARDVAQQKWGLVLIYGLSYLAVLSITYFRDIPYSIRSGLFAGLFFLIAVTDLLKAGMSGEGRLSMMTFIIMATILASERNLSRSLITGFAALATMTLIGLAMSSGWINKPSTQALANSYHFSEWLNGNLVFLMLITAIVSSILLLLAQTQRALKNQEQFTRELEVERNKLQANFDLQSLVVNRRATELETASSLAHDISKFSDLDALLSNAVNLIRNQFGFYHAGLFLLDPNKEYAVLRSATGDAGRQMLAQNHRLRVGEVGIVGHAVSRGESRIVQDVQQDSFHYKNPILPDTRSELALPLRVAGEVIGALDVQSTKEMAFSQDDVKILQLIADQLAVAINKAQILQQLQQNVEELETRYSQTAMGSWNQYMNTENQTVSLSLSKATREFSNAAPLAEEEIKAISEKKSVLVTKSLPGGLKSTELSLPLKLRDNMILGALRIEFEEETVPEQTIEMLENISNRLALALDRARLMQEIQSTAKQDRLITDVTAKIRSSSNIDNILKTAASEIGRSLGAAEVIVQLLPTHDN